MDTPEQTAIRLLAQMHPRAGRYFYVVWGKSKSFLAFPEHDTCALSRYGEHSSRLVGKYTRDVSPQDLADDIEHYQLTVQQVRRVEVVE